MSSSPSGNKPSTSTKPNFRSPLSAALMMNAGKHEFSPPQFPDLGDILQDNRKDRSLHSILGEALDALHEEERTLDSETGEALDALNEEERTLDSETDALLLLMPSQ